MTTTEPYGAYAPPPTARRPLRRSRTDRVGAGVAGGLGEYFRVDPVLFRVLFATAAFFGGVGVLAYLLAWAAIPEAGTEKAPIDGWIHGLRQRRTPFVLVACAVVLIFWLVAFSWWAPGPSLPLVIIVVVLVLIFGHRRGGPDSTAARESGPSSLGAQAAADPGVDTGVDTVNLEKSDAPETETTTLPPVDEATARHAPGWVKEFREWADESRAASRRRRRRAMPLRLAGLGVLAVTITVLGLIDAASGIAIPTYFWFSLVILVATLLTGMVLRRTPWGLTALLVPTIIGLIGFGGTHASLHDGIGQKEWRPSTFTTSHYKLAFGQGVLDLRSLPTATTPEVIDVTMASGQVRVIAPTSMNLSVRAEVHFGTLTVDGRDYEDVDGFHSRGVNLDRTVPPSTGATGAPVLVRVHLADGDVSLDHR